MTEWNAHQRLGRAIREMARHEAAMRRTRARGTPQQKRAWRIARNCLMRAYFRAQDAIWAL